MLSGYLTDDHWESYHFTFTYNYNTFTVKLLKRKQVWGSRIVHAAVGCDAQCMSLSAASLSVVLSQAVPGEQ